MKAITAAGKSKKYRDSSPLQNPKGDFGGRLGALNFLVKQGADSEVEGVESRAGSRNEVEKQRSK